LDPRARRHFYRVAVVEQASEESLVGELGSLHLTEELGSIPVWIDRAGRLTSGCYRPDAPSPRAAQLMRWAAAPVRWRGFGRVRGRARAVLRRSVDAAAIGLASRHAGDGSRAYATGATEGPVGYLYSTGGPRRHELLAAIHPVTGDQLLTFHPLEAADMGYSPAVSLGYVLTDMPPSGGFAPGRIAVPWATRFGLKVRRA